MINKIALEFAQYVLQQNPKAKSFVAMYDAMSRAATFRSFRNLGHEELARLGISFSLLATDKLEHVIEEARMALSGQYIGSAREIKKTIALDGRRHEILPFGPRPKLETISQPNVVSPSPLALPIHDAIRH